MIHFGRLSTVCKQTKEAAMPDQATIARAPRSPDLTTDALPDRSVIPAVWTRYTDIVVDHGEGSWLIDTEGRRYLDYSSGIGVTNTGHAHPRVVAAVQAQVAKLLHGQQNIVFHEPGLRLHDRLRRVLPGDGWGVFLSNSGAEAVEAAVKLARAATGRPAIVTFRGGFHGRTGQTMALSSSRVNVRGDFEPLPGSVYMTGYPYCFRDPSGTHDVEACTCNWEEQLDLLFAQVIRPTQVAALLVEPVLGEGGYAVPPRTFLPRLRDIADRHGILMIADEIQTGFGRTGRMFAVEHTEVRPDIVTMAKGIASGLPLSGLIARRELFNAWAPGVHGGTYGGNVVACAAALATLDVIQEEGLIENAALRGRQLVEGLRNVAGGDQRVGDVRGLGCMVALEFVNPKSPDGRAPDPATAALVTRAALQRGLILLVAGSYGQVVRIVPPLVTTAAEIDRAVGIIGESLAASAA
jgi:4-aminobutyrate aminotransferase